VVLNAGRIEQVGSPLELYRTPANLFVAGFIGSPRMNLIEGAEARKLQAATIGVRPEHVRLSTAEGAWSGTVGVAEHLGSDTLLHIDADELGQITARADGEFPVEHGQRIFMTPDRERMHRFNEQGLAIR
jgi:multiple sugar transport system ATP-binding protein